MQAAIEGVSFQALQALVTQTVEFNWAGFNATPPPLPVAPPLVRTLEEVSAFDWEAPRRDFERGTGAMRFRTDITGQHVTLSDVESFTWKHPDQDKSDGGKEVSEVERLRTMVLSLQEELEALFAWDMYVLKTLFQILQQPRLSGQLLPDEATFVDEAWEAMKDVLEWGDVPPRIRLAKADLAGQELLVPKLTSRVELLETLLHYILSHTQAHRQTDVYNWDKLQSLLAASTVNSSAPTSLAPKRDEGGPTVPQAKPPVTKRTPPSVPVLRTRRSFRDYSVVQEVQVVHPRSGKVYSVAVEGLNNHEIPIVRRVMQWIILNESKNTSP